MILCGPRVDPGALPGTSQGGPAMSIVRYHQGEVAAELAWGLGTLQAQCSQERMPSGQSRPSKGLSPFWLQGRPGLQGAAHPGGTMSLDLEAGKG